MRLRHTLSRITVAALIATTMSATVATHPVTAVTPGAIAVRLVKGGLNDPSGFTFAPGGLIYYVERGTGQVRILNLKTHLTRSFFNISGVNGDGERGALGIALSPGWPLRPFVYVYVTRAVSGTLHNQIIRIRAESGHGVAAHVIFQTTAVTVLYHNGGRILFGPGGDLYAMVGDGHTDANAQDLIGNPRGKILRMNPDGSIPATNPIPGSRMWSFGHRNSFGFTFDPLTSHLWETENGPACNDEINLDVRDGNFGWGANENCSGTSPGDTDNSGPTPRLMPKWFTQGTIGITGDAFCHGCGLGSQYAGDLFFGAYNTGALRVLQLNAGRTGFVGGASTVLTAPNGVILSMETAPDGTIYFSEPGGIYKLVAA